MSKIDDLLSAYKKQVSLPWADLLSAQEKVWFCVYDPSQERRLRKQIEAFSIVTQESGHTWLPLDVTGIYDEWLSTNEYKEQYLRKKELNLYSDIDDYLASLNMILTIKINDIEKISRVSELTQKTNQFNLTTRRYTEEEINSLMLNNIIYTLSVSDKFGDNGLTGVCIIRNNIIDNFLLSCRILGRKIEYCFIDWIINDLKNKGINFLIGEYIPTKKNEQVATFYDTLGFKFDNIQYKYKIEIKDYKPSNIKYFNYG